MVIGQINCETTEKWVIHCKVLMPREVSLPRALVFCLPHCGLTQIDLPPPLRRKAHPWGTLCLMSWCLIPNLFQTCLLGVALPERHGSLVVELEGPVVGVVTQTQV